MDQLSRPRPPSRHRRRWPAARAAVPAALTLTLLAALLTPQSAAGEEQVRPGARPSAPEISTLSGRPDTVSGGDALIEVRVDRATPLNRVRVEVNGTDVTAGLTADDDARTLTGVVDGLAVGENTVTARGPSQSADTGELTVVNHPQEGPVVAGPHEQPFICETQHFTVPVIGGNLGTALDENCTFEPRVDHFYRTTANAYRAWPADATAYPDDLAMTTTSEGVEVPFIVRMETTPVNRAIAQSAVLHDPLADHDPTPTTARPAGWNGSAIFTLGGGCTNGWYRQGRSTGGVTNDYMLGQGFAVMSSSLNVFGSNCSDLIAAESAIMVKESFVERYGPIDNTIGYGSSGGSYQGHQIGDNYSGVFDGIIVGASFPEVGFGTVNFISDAWLLHHYFTTDAAVEWTAEQKRQVTGFLNYATAPNVANGARRIDPTAFCGVVPVALRYHPDTNPTGARCDVYDHTVNVYGADPDTGFALRPLDNVGIQYGLEVLQDGSITVDQFLDLNERVGGFDHDATITDERSVADLPAVRAAYRTGRLTNGGGGLADIPIIDYRGYTDDASNGDIHVRYHTFSMRERLEKANGTAANHVSLLDDNKTGGFGTGNVLIREAFLQMDRWLTDIAADTSDAEPIDKIVEHRPADLLEGCKTRGADWTFIAQPLDRDPASECEQLYPSASFPREVAGESIAADVVKCRLKEPSREDYAVEFTDEQWQRLQEVFDGGVCDYTVPGEEQQGLAGTWLRF